MGARPQSAPFSIWNVLQTIMAGLILSGIGWTGATVLSHGSAISHLDGKLDAIHSSELAHIRGSSVRDTVVRLVQNTAYCDGEVNALGARVDAKYDEHRELLVELARSISDVRSNCNRLSDKVDLVHRRDWRDGNSSPKQGGN